MAKKDFIIQDGLDPTGETVLGILNVPITISTKYAANNNCLKCQSFVLQTKI